MKQEGRNLVGTLFTRLWVLKHVSIIKNKRKRRYCLCRCLCGQTEAFLVREDALLEGKIQSCKCLNREIMRALKPHTTHGLRHHPLYSVWCGLKVRCGNPNNQAYHNYGGRGITVCDEWKTDVKAFHDWAMANGWQKGLDIDRIDNDGNYEPSNCRFITPLANANNKRNTIWVVVDGERTSVNLACTRLKIVPGWLAYQRIYRDGWNALDAVTTPRIADNDPCRLEGRERGKDGKFLSK